MTKLQIGDRVRNRYMPDCDYVIVDATHGLLRFEGMPGKTFDAQNFKPVVRVKMRRCHCTEVERYGRPCLRHCKIAARKALAS